MLVSMLIALSVITHAQDTAAPAAAAAPAETEMQKWIGTTDAQWQVAFKRDVTDVHLTELEKLKQQYVALLEAAVTKASSAGDLDGAVALRNEEKRFAGTNLFPEQDDAADAATIKQIRASVRAQIARLERDTAARTKALHAKYDQVLAQAQTQLTQRQRIDDALLVKGQARRSRRLVARARSCGCPREINPGSDSDHSHSRSAKGRSATRQFCGAYHCPYQREEQLLANPDGEKGSHRNTSEVQTAGGDSRGSQDGFHGPADWLRGRSNHL